MSALGPARTTTAAVIALCAAFGGCSSSITIDADAGAPNDAGRDASMPPSIDAGAASPIDARIVARVDAGHDADLSDACASSLESCNGVDDDCDALVDEAPAADACDLPSAVGLCDSAACGIAACVDRHRDCDGVVTNGCEIDIAGDRENCGACGRSCPTGATCEDGLCDAERVLDLSSGPSHSCVVRAGGDVLCWGIGTDGQLGDGTSTTHEEPLPVLGIDDAVDVECGGEYSCALHATGRLSCWGNNSSGQLGDGTESSSPVPVSVLLGAERVTAFAVGGTSGSGWPHTCAVVDAGAVRCWGQEMGGALGDGRPWMFRSQTTPVSVLGVTDAVVVGVWTGRSCVLERTGLVQCWGDNWEGGLGDTWPERWRLTAGPVPTLSGIVALAWHGTAHTAFALDDRGTLWGWGGNIIGELGDGTMDARTVPVAVVGLEGETIHTISIAQGTSWVSLETGRVRFVGYDYFSSARTTAWVEAPVVHDAVQVVGSYRGGCVLHAHGSVSCAGVFRHPVAWRAVIGLPPLEP